MNNDRSDDAPHLDKIDARGGTRNKANRNVLVISLVLIVIAFIVVVGSGFFSTHRTGADEVNANNGTASRSMNP